MRMPRGRAAVPAAQAAQRETQPPGGLQLFHGRHSESKKVDRNETVQKTGWTSDLGLFIGVMSPFMLDLFINMTDFVTAMCFLCLIFVAPLVALFLVN